jgi:hypothetical protein
MDNVLIVVDDLEAAKSFFIELGLELEGETLDIARVFADGHKPKMRVPANEAVYDGVALT